ncbi:Trk system potassium uptake protein [Hypericibacter terrae]|uniref:Trk system potassium uptake protein n=1 Tax=Hypericibacter terrae TaxID=2602015 RepID=A0A5J6MD68_9PROT|nr:TrkH family potassium uptake protein [Hypericibacter terrae]QEX15329.1 Trk system potassium uptake protein [Hypericibacter terrae]
MPDFRAVFFIIGFLLLALAAAMLLPAAIDALAGDPDWRAFSLSAISTGVAGAAMVLGFRQAEPPQLRAREGFLLVTVSWIVLAGFATLPLMLTRAGLDFTDAYFESMSGLTTTGASVLPNLDGRPMGVLLWRALLHWVGGIGIIVIAVTIFPILRVGGMQLFRMESSDKSEKIRPRVSQVSSVLISVYVTLTTICAVALVIAGMPAFDAVCHAMATLATGGFSTHDASVGYFHSPAVEWILTFFMLIAGMTFVLLARAARGDLTWLWHDDQTRWYLLCVLLFAAGMTFWQWEVNGRAFGDSLRSSSFNVVSIITTTGFASEDYLVWGSMPMVMFMVLLFLGACTGSTAGGIKFFRICVVGAVARSQIAHMIHPHRVTLPFYNGLPISDEVVRSVLSFIVFYIATFAAISIAVSAFGMDLVAAMSAVAQAIANVGPGLTPEIGPIGNYASLHDGAKWLLSLAMMLGRLELLTVLVLLSRTYWRG